MIGISSSPMNGLGLNPRLFWRYARCYSKPEPGATTSGRPWGWKDMDCAPAAARRRHQRSLWGIDFLALHLQVPPQKVFGPSKPTPNTFSEGTWRPRVDVVRWMGPGCATATIPGCVESVEVEAHAPPAVCWAVSHHPKTVLQVMHV